MRLALQNMSMLIDLYQIVTDRHYFLGERYGFLKNNLQAVIKLDLFTPSTEQKKIFFFK